MEISSMIFCVILGNIFHLYVLIVCILSIANKPNQIKIIKSVIDNKLDDSHLPIQEPRSDRDTVKWHISYS